MAGSDVNWTEGLFIQPHHFQQAFMNLEDQVGGVVSDYIPHYHGIAHLRFSESDCENYRFHITELDCRFPSGTRLVFPGNALIESRSFKEPMDANKGRLEVFLALPAVSDQDANCLRFDEKPLGGAKYRYLSKIEKVCDAVSGGNEREVEVKYLNPKILFSGESTFGYETIRIAVVERSGQFGSAPQPAADHIPPCIQVDASPILQEIKREAGNRLIARNRSLRSYWKSKDTATLMKARDAFKVQTLAVAANSFMQFTSANCLHPFSLYCKMTEIIGMLSLYAEDDRLVECPVYDHDNLGSCFARVHENLVRLLAMLEEASYESRVFEMGEEGLRCPLEPRWLDDKVHLYVCFEAGSDEAEVAQKLNALKVAPEKIIPILNKRRMRGMTLEGPLHHLPHLPTSAQHHYFKVVRDGTYFPQLKESQVLSIWGPQFADLVTLYIVEKK